MSAFPPYHLEGSVLVQKDNEATYQTRGSRIPARGQIFHVAFPESCVGLTDGGTQNATTKYSSTEFEFYFCVQDQVSFQTTS